MLNRLAPFDPEAEELRDDPYPILAEYRRGDPVHWGLPGVPGVPGAWYLFAHHDCEFVLGDPRFGKEIFHRMPAERFAKLPPVYQDYVSHIKNAMIVRDPPEHTRLRNFLQGAFTRESVTKLRPNIEQIAEELLDDMQRKHDDVDIMDDFAVPMPVVVVADLIGVPRADRRRLKEWSAIITRSLSGSFKDLSVYANATRATIEFGEYIEALAAKRRLQPEDDLLSALLAVESAGQKLTLDELISLCRTLLVGGHETTTNLIGNGFDLLQRDRAQLEELGEDEQRWFTATTEILRYESPVQFTFRLTYAEVEIGGKTIKPGDRVVTMLGSANRDEAVFEEPDRFKVRGSGGKPIHFGRGPHYCIGANLGQLEGAIALSRLFQRFPRIAPRVQPFPWRENLQFRGFATAPVALDGARVP
jgi:pimeloyl-[acyl-carrier protein] synthase